MSERKIIIREIRGTYIVDSDGYGRGCAYTLKTNAEVVDLVEGLLDSIPRVKPEPVIMRRPICYPCPNCQTEIKLADINSFYPCDNSFVCPHCNQLINAADFTATGSKP